jgi:hypothetical protein
MTRMIRSSTHPPERPANDPIRVPKPAEISTTARLNIREIRAPKTSLESVSRPSSSRPRG